MSQFQVATCTFVPGAGPLNVPGVQVFNATNGADIHYTMNDLDDPTQSDPPIANGGTVTLTPVNGTVTLKAKAWKTGFDPSRLRKN